MKYAKRYERKNTFVFFALSFLIASTIFAAITSVHEVTTAASTETDVWDGSSSSTSWAGQGTEVDPYIIDSCAKFKGFANNTLNGTTYSGFTFKITKNLNFNGNAIWMNNFSGILDGNGNTIFNANSTKAVGAPGCLCETASGATIRNITFDSCKAENNFGFIIDTATNCTLINCTVNASCSGGCGFMYMLNGGSVLSCTNRASYTQYRCPAGFVCFTQGTVYVKDCKNYGNITSIDDSNAAHGAGGIVSNCQSGYILIMRCINFGTITGAGTSSNRIGGILGQANATTSLRIDKCINKGPLNGNADNAGGILGVSVSGYLLMYNCINLASINAYKNWGGGLVGYINAQADIFGCANGIKSGTDTLGNAPKDERIGALAGYTSNGTIAFKNCYNLHGNYYCIGYVKVKGTADKVWTAGTDKYFQKTSSGLNDYSSKTVYYGQFNNITNGAAFADTLNANRAGQYQISKWGICDDPEVNYPYAVPGYSTLDTVYADWVNGVDQGVQSSSKGPYGEDSQPVQSVQDAKWMCKKTTASTILAKTMFTVEGYDYWGFSDKPNVTLKRNSSTNTGYMVQINGTGNLRVEDLVIDGGYTWSGTTDSYLNRGTTFSPTTVAQSAIANAAGSVLNMANCTIQNNVTKYAGGALRLGSAGYTGLTDCTVANCAADINSGDSNKDQDGGGIWMGTAGNKLIMNNVEVYGCSAKASSGGLYFTAGTATVTECSVHNNSCTGGITNNANGNRGGGGVCLTSTSATVTLTNTNVSNNYSSTYGGGIANYGNLTFNGGTIESNGAANGAGIYGGGGTLTVNANAQINNNVASSNGGGIYFNINCNLSSVSLTGNSAANGGGMYVPSGKTVTLTGVTVQQNTATMAGGIYVDGGTCTIGSGTTVSNNEASVILDTASAAYAYGGGVYNTGSLTINSGGTISGNKVRAWCFSTEGGYAYGGGVYNTGSLTINSGGTISGNKVIGSGWPGEAYGGGVYNTGSLTISGGAINENELNPSGPNYDDSYGGGVYNDSNGAIIMDSGSIDGNFCKPTGSRSNTCMAAGVYNGGTFELNGGSINNNEIIASNLSSNSNGVGVNSAGTFTMTAGTINNNKGGIKGGGVYFRNASNTITGGEIKNNTSEYGGGIYLYYGATTSLSNVSINGNTANSQGGGIYLDQSSTLTMENVTINNNTSGNQGGGVYNNGYSLRVSGAMNISGNSSGSGAVNSNVYNTSGKTVTLLGNLSGTGTIGISTESTPTASTQVNVVQAGGTNLTTISDANKAYFTSDNTSYRIVRTPADPSKLKLAVYPTWTVTIPAVTSSSTTSTVNLAASLTGFVEGLDNVDVKLEVPTGGLFSLTHPNDSSSVIKYQVEKGGTALSAGTQTVATFNTGQTTQDLTYTITDMSGAKYAGAHKSAMIFKVAYRES